MKTLYRFKLDDDGTISMREVTGYEETGAYYVYRYNSAHHWVSKNNIDNVFHNQVYTFDPDIEHAKKIMYNIFVGKAKKAYDEYMKYAKLAEKVV